MPRNKFVSVRTHKDALFANNNELSIAYLPKTNTVRNSVNRRISLKQLTEISQSTIKGHSSIYKSMAKLRIPNMEDIA